MMESAIVFRHNLVSIGYHEWAVPFTIDDCVLIGDKVVVLYEITSEQTWGQFRNLEAFGLDGQKLWTAEHPTNETADVYVRILNHEPLTVLNFAGFTCQLDLLTGKIIKKEFTK